MDTISALDVANTILVRAEKDHFDINPMKLQKLLYILYKTYLKQTETRLFEDRFEVWKTGPVIKTIQEAFSRYGSNHITAVFLAKPGSYNTVKFGHNSDFDIIFEGVWKKHKRHSGAYLSKLSCREGTAWAKANERNDFYLNDSDIYAEEYF